MNGQQAAEALLALKEEIARATVEALYAELPDLLEKYGERGRRKCLEDMRYNVEHLAPAVALGDPRLFARYASWLGALLGARRIPVGEVRRSLELMRDAIAELLTEEETAAAHSSIAAGLAALDGPLAE